MTSSHLVAVAVTTLWTAPDAPRDTASQALLGEPADVIGARGGWVQVVLPWQPSSLDARGYPGWLPASHLTPAVEAGTDDDVVAVRRLTATLRTRDGTVQVSGGTVLPARRRDGAKVEVVLPGGGVGSLDAADVVRRASPSSAAPDRTAVTVTARQFLGLPYLWGGTSGWGVDCSGLVHLAHRMHGVVVPRDAADQQEALAGVDLDDVRSDDLLFFADPDEPAHHVGFATSAGPPERLHMLHAPRSGELVEEGPLDGHRRETLSGAARSVPAWGP